VPFVGSTEVVRKQLHRSVPLCMCVTLDSSTVTAPTDLYETEHVPGMSVSDVVAVAIAWRFNRSGGCGTWPFNHGYDDVSRGTITPGDYPVSGVPFAPEPPSLVMGTTAGVVGLGLGFVRRYRVAKAA
jgi:hypothetical protein